ncbi:hypothetical protein [Dysgonomonas macrotermitis]|uniref:Uncharacterized protein n=1 Tax=Dysgonomonas macrotermitis TaxID=1346286 RepID=A0A1M4WBY5_9BACT|nr:hypothetical protein [Dysgonomonas macrotermitis]SHE78660.1 hypothetical protein SAMN05444362_102185 [Dysgonomonas macrotermitis]
MYWQEKLNIIKKKYPSLVFRDMFHSGGEVAEKIIRKFHNATYLTFKQCDDPKTLLKDCRLVKETGILELENYLYELEDGINYWLFLLNPPMGNTFQVYDCRKAPLIDLYYLASGREDLKFYIVDKKYEWLLLVEIETEENTAFIYESKANKNGKEI